VHTKFWAENLKGRDHLRHRWENNIKMDLGTIRYGRCCVDWIHLAQDRGKWQALINMVMNFQVP
jgi:hypothetical protein